MKKKQKKVLPDEVSEEAIAEKAKSEEEISEVIPDEEIPEEEIPKTEKPDREGESSEEKRQAMEEDIELFHSLFPKVGAKDIPEEVWQSVESGESLAASYALYFVKNAKEEERIRDLNEANAKKAPPRIGDDGKEADYFSPEAVKGMTRDEIKKNYKAILRSMDSWK